MTLLNVEGLTKSFVIRRDLLGRPSDEVHAVKDVSFSIEPGETVALVGESGSGKSTTGRLVLRLIEPDRGVISFNGIDVRNLPRRELRRLRQKMQVIFQDPLSSFDPSIAIGDSIAEPLLVHFRTPRRERLRTAAALLERVGMSTHYLARSPRELSGGQLQRAAIARALTLKPQLIVCDECVAALDVSIRAQVLNLMIGLQKDMGMSYLFITHDLALVRAIAHRVNVMSQGEIVERGSVADLFAHPSQDYTKQLLSSIPSLAPRPRRIRSPTE
jgi:ABC-type oligopeptide transport system ATPase subunit